jgi:hypothetical protein
MKIGIENSGLAKTEVRSEAIVVCGIGEVGWSLINVLTNAYVADLSKSNGVPASPPTIVAFDNNPKHIEKALGASKNTVILFGKQFENI